jgi:beta-glucanase (GH16 family)
MDSLKDVQQNTVYLGDASNVNWVSSGIPVVYNNEALLLTMAESTVGTLLTSTHYVWYGKISAKMTSSQGKGVVTAFIMMSDMKDEIDFEFVGETVSNVQSNYYFQGITDCKCFASGNASGHLPLTFHDRRKHDQIGR